MPQEGFAIALASGVLALALAFLEGEGDVGILAFALVLAFLQGDVGILAFALVLAFLQGDAGVLAPALVLAFLQGGVLALALHARVSGLALALGFAALALVFAACVLPLPQVGQRSKGLGWTAKTTQHRCLASLSSGQQNTSLSHYRDN